MTDTDLSPSAPTAKIPSAVELAASVSARLCHDFISPASAIVSGLDLLEDPDSQDMREEAMSLIADSARKLSAHLMFARVAFGASAAADTFDPRDLKGLADGVFAHVRADLVWAVALEAVNKPAARTLLNLAQIGSNALPSGGVATVDAVAEPGAIVVTVKAESPKVRLHAEVAEGLAGKPLTEGLAGRWVQSYYVSRVVDEAGGTLSHALEEGVLTLTARVPA